MIRYITYLLVIIIESVFHCKALYLYDQLLLSSNILNDASSFISVINIALCVGYMLFAYLSNKHMTQILNFDSTLFVLFYNILYPANTNLYFILLYKSIKKNEKIICRNKDNPNLQGVPEEKDKQYIIQYCRYCHIDKPVMKLSCGTKCKVSLLLSVCDPATHLFVWDMIKEIHDTGYSYIILTIHSMEEAQELCNSLTILINGRLVCIGSPDYLRMKYNNSYIMEIQTGQQEKIQKLSFDAEKGAFPENEYKLETISMKIIRNLEPAKSNHDLVDYTLSQSTSEHYLLILLNNLIMNKT
ncbi:hypothetical protein H8356DRAFT_1365862 [Neocallimastix lanati (nom. inval.)]|nr:hypothetical protein H8356DRAFT_1365862 [Neocallimastix sp. JGI-2020a]